MSAQVIQTMTFTDVMDTWTPCLGYPHKTTLSDVELSPLSLII